MKRSILGLGLVALLAAWALPAGAQSPCCAANAQEESCAQIGEEGLAGCFELDADNCIGGGIIASEDPSAQSPLAGCICLGGSCVSDGSIGDGPGEADDVTCTRDAVVGCNGSVL